MKLRAPRLWLNAVVVIVVLAAVILEARINHMIFAGVPAPTAAAPPALPAGALAAKLPPNAPFRPGSLTNSHLDIAEFDGKHLTFSGNARPIFDIKHGTPVRFAGWAIDLPNKTADAGIAVQIDDRARIASQGIVARPDVATALGNPAYTDSGFDVIVPATALPLGHHQVTLLVLTADRTAFYDVTDIAEINVK